MKKTGYGFCAALCLALLPAGAGAQAAGPSAAPASYDLGMEQRRAGDHGAARETFLRLLEKDPDSNGGLEGLALSCISLGRYGEAKEALRRWDARSPGNRYVLGLLLRAARGDGDEEAALKAASDLAALDGAGCADRERAEAYLERLRPGAFPRLKSYKSYAAEGLNTASPQRIVYEGRSAGARFRAPLRPGLDIIGGAELREEAQRNDGQGFTYYDLLEQGYSAGLAGRHGARARWEAEYGFSVISGVDSPAVGRSAAGRGRAYYEGPYSSGALRFYLATQPRFARRSGAGDYFLMLRESSARAEADLSLLGWAWTARAGAYALSGGTGLGTVSLRGTREARPGVFSAGYAHGQQEFYSASSDGKLRFVQTDRLSGGFRRGEEGRYRVSASAAEVFYSDENRLAEAEALLEAWLPRSGEFSWSYRYSLLDFLRSREGYDTLDERGHWLGAWWRRCAAGRWSFAAGYEKGFISDDLNSYQANRYTGSAEWYGGESGSLRLTLLKRDSAGRGKGYSLGLQARYGFR